RDRAEYRGAQAAGQRDPGARLRAGAVRAARPVHHAVGLAHQPAGRPEIAGHAALQHREEVMAKAVSDDYLRRIPKAELHCHLAGALRATTVAELAKRAGLPLPRPADKLYQWPDFNGFLEVLRLTGSVLRTPEDFARAVYEYVEDAVRDGNLRHVEFFFNPDYFYPNGIDYPAMVDGMIEGIEAAKKKFGVSSLLICCIDRSTNTPTQAVEIVETAI